MMKRYLSKSKQLVAGSVPIILLAAFFTWYAVVEWRAARLTSWAKEQAYEIRFEDLSTAKAMLSVQISGSSDFQLQVTRAFRLLELCDFEMHAYVTNAVGIVQEGFTTSASFTNRPPLVTMDSKTAFHSLTWCAAGLVHEAHHIVLAKRRGETNQFTASFGPLRGYKNYQREELECFELEIQILKKLRAPRSELDFVRSQDGTHFDVNRDGKWNLEDGPVGNTSN